MNEELRARLMGVSTGTLTYQLLKRNIRNVYMRGVLPLHPVRERMVGVAYTLRFIPMREDVADLAVPSARAWAKTARLDRSAYPNVVRWLDACLARDAYGRVKAIMKAAG